jgi:hypothetical protein
MHNGYAYWNGLKVFCSIYDPFTCEVFIEFIGGSTEWVKEKELSR